MEEKTLLAFAKWMQSKDQQLASVPVEQLAAQVAQALQTPEGQKQLAPLFQQFQSEVGVIMRSGGKMDYAVKRMWDGGQTEKVKAPKSEIQSWDDDRRFDKYDDYIYLDPYHYKMDEDGNWYDTTSGRSASDDTQIALNRISYHRPSIRTQNQRRNFDARQQTVVDEDANTAYILTTGQPRQNYNMLNAPKEIDSVITRKHGFNRGQEASNKDWGVKFYRNFPKTSEFFGFVPEFERWKVMFDKK